MESSFRNVYQIAHVYMCMAQCIQMLQQRNRAVSQQSKTHASKLVTPNEPISAGPYSSSVLQRFQTMWSDIKARDAFHLLSVEAAVNLVRIDLYVRVLFSFKV